MAVILFSHNTKVLLHVSHAYTNEWNFAGSSSSKTKNVKGDKSSIDGGLIKALRKMGGTKCLGVKLHFKEAGNHR